MHWPVVEASDPPRALRGLARIINNGLCHRCGSCVGICPTNVLGLDDNEYPKIKNLSACTDCDLCARVCPGDEFAYEESYQAMFGQAPNMRDTHGFYLDSFLGHATDPEIRQNSSSGGLVTGLLLHMLECKAIDGAVVIAADEKKLWKGKPILATTREELLASLKSKYAIVATNSVFSEILEKPGRYALVGLPCQIHGYVKAAELDPRLHERVVLTIGLYCHSAVEHDAFEIIWNNLGKRKDRARRFVSRVGKHPGAPHIELDDGSLYPVYFGNKKGYRPSSMEMINILYRTYTPERCLTCFDALAEFADISVGDPWMAPPDKSINFYDGWSFVFTRTKRGQLALQTAIEQDAIKKFPVPRYLAKTCNKTMSTEKRWRAFRVIETLRRQGKSIPSYGNPFQHFPKLKGWKFIRVELGILSHILCFIPKWRAPALKIVLSELGYYLMWLNNKRRRLNKNIRNFRGWLIRKRHER